MDNLAHTLTGLMLSRAGLNRATPRAGAILMIAANLPDVDVVAAVGGAAAYLDWHRGPTHSALLLPVTAFAAAALARAFGRPDGWRWLNAWLVACCGVASHLLLDWTNIYGIRLLSPVSGRWFRLDAVSVVDPVIWALLLAALFWPWLAGLVGSEIGAPRTRPGRGLSVAALLALIAYDFSRWALHGRAVATMSEFLYDGRAPRRVLAMPDVLNPFRWRGLIDLGGQWQVQWIRLGRPYDPASGQLYYSAPPSAAIAAARQTRAFQALERFSQTLVWRELPAADKEGATEVVVTDLRFALPGEGRFAARAVVTPSGRVIGQAFQFMPKGDLPRAR